jgi:exosortase
MELSSLKTETRGKNGLFLGFGRSVIVQLCLVVSLFFFLYSSVLKKLVTDWWEDPNYSHGFLIPLLGVYFVWERREKLSNLEPQPNQWGLSLLLLGLGILFLGYIGAELFLMRSSMLVVISGLVLYLLGWRHLKVLVFPIGFLLFMIPFPSIIFNAIAFPLQLMAAKTSTFCLQLLQVPVLREGNVIVLPHTTLEVTEACSGIRSLMSLTALAVVFAYFTQRDLWKRLVLVLLAIPIAILTNAFRVWGTGLLAHYFGVEAALGFYHTFAGWLVFVVAFGLLLVAGILLSRIGVWPTKRWRANL